MYSRRERERDFNYAEAEYDQESPAEYSSSYQRSQRLSRNSNSFSSPTTPNYEFSRQRTWPNGGGGGSGGSGGGSYEDRERGFTYSYNREREREYDGYASSPRTQAFDPRSHGGAGSSVGSTTRRSRDMPESSRYETRHSPRDRERDRDRDRERDRDRDSELDHDRDRDRDRDFDRERERERERGERDRNIGVDRDMRRQRAQDKARRRMVGETKNYPRRLRDYLYPILDSQPAMHSAVEVFMRLDEDSRYLTSSCGALLESLAAVTDGMANSSKAADWTGLDDPPSDSELTEESAFEDSETAAESADSDDDDQLADYAETRRQGRDSVGSTMGPMARRRSSAATAAASGGGAGMGTAEERRRKNSMDIPSPMFMQWGDLMPHALSKATDGINDRRRSFLALAQTISNSLIMIGMEAVSMSGRSGSASSSNLSAKGLLAELARVLRPHDYRAYFRASARVLLLPNTVTMRRPNEIALEALERQLLGTTKFGQALSAAAMTDASSAAIQAAQASPMVACLTFSSASYGTIALYRFEMASSREGGDWPRRIQPVSAMTGVPKELLRRSVRAMPPSRRTVLKIGAIASSSSPGLSGARGDRDKYRDRDREGSANGGSGNSNGSSNGGLGSGGSSIPSRLRWVSLPGDAPVPNFGYSPNVGGPAFEGSLRTALGIEDENLKIGAGATANYVCATIPAMLAWLHVKAAYLTNVELEATEVQRGSSGSKSSTKGRDRDMDDTSSIASSQRTRLRRITRCKRGPTPMDHEGRDPCIVVLHPNRGDWVTAPVYWTEARD